MASFISQALDTLLFTFIFLGGVLPLPILLKTALVAYLVKVTLGAFDTPFVYLGVKLARHFDLGSHSQELRAYPVKTTIFKKGDDLLQFITASIPTNQVQEKTIIALTSKLMSIAENCIVPKVFAEGSEGYRAEKTALVKKEADQYLGETLYGVSLTLKHGILIPTAGIDESNSENAEYLLFPKDPYRSTKALWEKLRVHYGVKNLGLILTDSHTTPLRKGVTGIGLAHAGFKATRDLVGSPDLFGRIMKMTHVNVLDALATTAVYKMGETNDCAPLAILHSNDVEFTENFSQDEIRIPMDEDLYGVFFKG